MAAFQSDTEVLRPVLTDRNDQPGLSREVREELARETLRCLDSPAPLPAVRLRGVTIHAVTERQCIRHILDELDGGRGGWVTTPNLDHLRRLVHDPIMSQLYSDASLVVADGMPLVWACRLQGTPLPERVAGSSLVSTLSEAAAARGKSVFLLGGSPGTAAAAADRLVELHPALRIAGTCCPPVGFEHDPEELERLTEIVQQASPDIVYVALGSPKQELLIAGLRPLLPQAWWLGVGISFSFLCGDIRRAPGWMQHSGLEWLHRLLQEPRRLARRYLLQGLPFACGLMAVAAVHRFGHMVMFGTRAIADAPQA